MKNSDLENMSCEELKTVIVNLFNKAEAGKHGRNECAWCKKDMGVCFGIARGMVSHGICPTCAEFMKADCDAALRS